MSTAILVNVICDASVWPYLEVKAAVGWHRVTVYLRPPLRESRLLRSLFERAVKMLAADGVVLSGVRAILRVDGPDADDAARDQIGQLSEQWEDVVLTVWEAVSESTKRIAATAREEKVPAVAPAETKSVKGVRPKNGTDEERLINSMVTMVTQYVKEFGANPDFGSTKPEAVRKAHNYIKSVTTRQNAPIEILEAVRTRLIT